MDTVKERPILFSSPMVNAILEGRKTQTRRAVKHPAAEGTYGWHPSPTGFNFGPGGSARPVCPYGKIGDRLWVRETHTRIGCKERCDHLGCHWRYKADERKAIGAYGALRWKPSIHMPRWASRITLEIAGVRVERLQGISRDDSIAEGLSFVGDGGACWGVPGLASTWCGDPCRSYQSLWEEINGTESWAANPWAWVIEFKRVTS